MRIFLTALFLTLSISSWAETDQCDSWQAQADLYYAELTLMSHSFQAFYAYWGSYPEVIRVQHDIMLAQWDAKSDQYDRVQEQLFLHCDVLV